MSTKDVFERFSISDNTVTDLDQCSVQIGTWFGGRKVVLDSNDREDGGVSIKSLIGKLEEQQFDRDTARIAKSICDRLIVIVQEADEELENVSLWIWILTKIRQISNIFDFSHTERLDQLQGRLNVLLGQGIASQKIAEEEVLIASYQHNLQYMKTKPIPPLPKGALDLGEEDMLEVFSSLNFDNKNGENYLDPASVLKDGYGPAISVAGVKKQIGTMWEVARGERSGYFGQDKHYGLPNSNRETDKFCRNLHKLLKHITYLSFQEGVPPITKAMSLINVAIGGGHCAGRYMQEGVLNYTNLLPFATDPEYKVSSSLENLPVVEVNLIDLITRRLEDVRIKIFDGVVGEVNNNDLSHTRNYFMKHLGANFGLPGANEAGYDDSYEGYATTSAYPPHR